MAITSSAKKAIRSSAHKRLFNLRRRAAIQKVQRRIKKLIAEKKLARRRHASRLFTRRLIKRPKLIS